MNNFINNKSVIFFPFPIARKGLFHYPGITNEFDTCETSMVEWTQGLSVSQLSYRQNHINNEQLTGS